MMVSYFNEYGRHCCRWRWGYGAPADDDLCTVAVLIAPKSELPFATVGLQPLWMAVTASHVGCTARVCVATSQT